MKLVKKISKWVVYILLIPISYIVISLILTTITVDQEEVLFAPDNTIYISTNGVHLDLILEKRNVDNLLLKGIKQDETDNYLSFGWGDENFYINTPSWGDLTFNNAFRAMFLKSSTLMHITRYKQKQSNWIAIEVSDSELEKLNLYLLNSFETTENGAKIILENKGYSYRDDFYKAKGSYSCLKTCNSWVNTGLKESGLKSCLWTPFDFGLINKYE